MRVSGNCSVLGYNFSIKISLIHPIKKHFSGFFFAQLWKTNDLYKGGGGRMKNLPFDVQFLGLPPHYEKL